VASLGGALHSRGRYVSRCPPRPLVRRIAVGCTLRAPPPTRRPRRAREPIAPLIVEEA